MIPAGIDIAPPPSTNQYHVDYVTTTRILKYYGDHDQDDGTSGYRRAHGHRDHRRPRRPAWVKWAGDKGPVVRVAPGFWAPSFWVGIKMNKAAFTTRLSLEV